MHIQILMISLAIQMTTYEFYVYTKNDWLPLDSVSVSGPESIMWLLLTVWGEILQWRQFLIISFISTFKIFEKQMT